MSSSSLSLSSSSSSTKAKTSPMNVLRTNSTLTSSSMIAFTAEAASSNHQRRTDFAGIFDKQQQQQQRQSKLVIDEIEEEEEEDNNGFNPMEIEYEEEDSANDRRSRSLSSSFGIPFGLIPSSFVSTSHFDEDDLDFGFGGGQDEEEEEEDDDDLMSSSTNRQRRQQQQQHLQLQQNQNQQQQQQQQPQRGHRRRRHFSLEDYENWDDSSFSNDSSHNNPQQQPSYIGGEDSSSQFKLQASLFPDDAVSLDTASDYICAQVLSEFETKLWNTLQSTNEKVIFPEGLLTVIAKHVLQEGSQEPCGLKGCRVNIYYEGYSDVHFLGTLVCDPTTTPTFQLTLTLRQSPKSWGTLLRRHSYVDVSTSYKLVKKCLYRGGQEDEDLYF